MKSVWARLGDAVPAGVAAGVGTTAALAALGHLEHGDAAAPINAVSHIAWGEEAGWAGGWSVQYTLTGFLLNLAACYSWAMAYQDLVDERVRARSAASRLAC